MNKNLRPVTGKANDWARVPVRAPGKPYVHQYSRRPLPEPSSGTKNLFAQHATLIKLIAHLDHERVSEAIEFVINMIEKTQTQQQE